MQLPTSTAWCELNSSTRTQRRAGKSLDGLNLHGYLSCRKEWRTKKGLGQLTCTLSMLVPITHWYQQKPGSPPCYLLYYYSESDKHHGSGITSCFPGPMDTSANAGLLLILGLQPEDEADYYCGISGFGN
uniref:Ig-like domain-containing protein n=1 Tax=Canis lupus familiaris TaxID=9615 RepID=A0A8C0RP55_CANLF